MSADAPPNITAKLSPVAASKVMAAKARGPGLPLGVTLVQEPPEKLQVSLRIEVWVSPPYRSA
jgi:hypothetical protein